MSIREYEKRHPFYSDGITKVTDPFWRSTCKKCGYVFLACLATAPCPKCGSDEADWRLGDIPFNQVVAERGYPIKSE